MVVGKIITKIIQTLPTWEVTKYYGRVCIFQLKCLKYKVQTSEAWFNFKCKYMPGSLREEIESEESPQEKKELAIKDKAKKDQKLSKIAAEQPLSMEQDSDDRRSRSSSEDSVNQSCDDDDHVLKRSKKPRSKAQRKEHYRDNRTDGKPVKVQKKARQQTQ